MAKKPRENRVPIMMSDEELTEVDDWRFQNRIATRSDAVRRLCRLGLIADQAVSEISDSSIAYIERLEGAYETARKRWQKLKDDESDAALVQHAFDHMGEIVDLLSGFMSLNVHIATIYNQAAPLADVSNFEEALKEVDKHLQRKIKYFDYKSKNPPPSSKDEQK